MEFNAADRATKLPSKKGTTVTDIEQQIAEARAQVHTLRLEIDLQHARIYQDLAYLEAQQAAADAARALHFDPIISASGKIAGWFKKEY